jgi:hypothetical protein
MLSLLPSLNSFGFENVMSTILTMLVAAMVAPSLTYMVLGSTQLLQQDRSAYAQTDSRDTITPFNTKVP